MNRVLAAAVALTLVSCPGFGEELRIRGTVKRGERFLHRLNHGIAFGLAPTEWRTANCDGWHLWIGPSREENFADLATGPLHGFSALDICAADFRNSNNSGPNGPGPLNVNRPGKVRQFRFVTTRAEDEQLSKLAGNPATASTVSAHIRLDNGALTITRLLLGHLEAGAPPTIEQMDFEVMLSVPNESRR
ncbi:MAG: hypothetical protein ABSF25_15165 [Bryobacteraceae bacterium]